jgi:hypothetical protein
VILRHHRPRNYQSIDTPLARIGAAQRAISRATKSRK